jgi:mycofactocin precursor
MSEHIVASDQVEEVPADQPPDAEVTTQDVLVEEISIDGMCGVY